MDKLKVEKKQQGTVTIFSLGGSLDTDTAPQFDETFAEQIEGGGLHYIIDLQELEYVSSAGIGVLVGTLNQLQEMGGDLRVAQMPEKIARILEMLDLLELFTVYPSLEEALASYS